MWPCIACCTRLWPCAPRYIHDRQSKLTKLEQVPYLSFFSNNHLIIYKIHFERLPANQLKDMQRCVPNVRWLSPFDSIVTVYVYQDCLRFICSPDCCRCRENSQLSACEQVHRHRQHRLWIILIACNHDICRHQRLILVGAVLSMCRSTLFSLANNWFV